MILELHWYNSLDIILLSREVSNTEHRIYHEWRYGRTQSDLIFFALNYSEIFHTFNYDSQQYDAKIFYMYSFNFQKLNWKEIVEIFESLMCVDAF